MIGGKVVEVCNVPNRHDVLFVEVADRPYSRVERLGVLVENNSISARIEIGDSIWWQGEFCYWTPQWLDGEKFRDVDTSLCRDIKIPKRSYSGVTFESVTQPEDSQ